MFENRRDPGEDHRKKFKYLDSIRTKWAAFSIDDRGMFNVFMYKRKVNKYRGRII